MCVLKSQRFEVQSGCLVQTEHEVHVMDGLTGGTLHANYL